MKEITISAVKYTIKDKQYEHTGYKRMVVDLRIGRKHHIIEGPLYSSHPADEADSIRQLDHMIKDKLFTAVFPDGLNVTKIYEQ